MAAATQLTNRSPHWKLPANTAISKASSNVSTTSLMRTPPISVKPSKLKISTICKSDKKQIESVNNDDNKESFLRMRRKLEESRKTFLNQHEQEEVHDSSNKKDLLEKQQELECLVADRLANQHKVTNVNKVDKTGDKTNSTPTNLKRNTNDDVVKRPTKKISFKIRKNASIYRRKDPKPLNLVQELTKKYNELDEQRQPRLPNGNNDKIHKLIKRVNSQNLKRRPSNKDASNVKRLIHEDKSNLTNVKAAIAIFEQKCNTCNSTSSSATCTLEKPKIPEKTFDVKAIAMRNQEKRMRLRQKLNASNTNNNDEGDDNEDDDDDDYMEDQQRNAIVGNNLCNDFNNSNNVMENNSGSHGNDGNNSISVGNHSSNGNLDEGNNKATSRGKPVSYQSADGDKTPLVMDEQNDGKPSDNIDIGEVCEVPEVWQVVSLPMTSMKRCESNYECQKFGRYAYSKTIFSTTNQNSIKTKIYDGNLRKSVSKSSLDEQANKILKVNELIGKSEHDKKDSPEEEPKIENKTHIVINISKPDVAKDTSEDDYDIVLPPADEPASVKLVSETQLQETLDESVPPLPPRIGKFTKIYSTIKASFLNNDLKAQTTDDDYEIPETPPDNTENIYESLSRGSATGRTLSKKPDCRLLRNQTEPLPPRPSSSSSSTNSNDEYNNESNYYESIYSKRDDNYESIYDGGIRIDGNNCKRNSISVQSIQSDQQSNSIYGRSITSWAEEVMGGYIGGGSNSSRGSGVGSGSLLSGKAASELSGSSDDWVDISDHENDYLEDGRGKCNKFVIVREARHQKVTKKNSGWSQQMREQWNKVPKNMQHNENGDTDSDHHYETLYSNGVPIQPHQHQLHHAEGHHEDDDDDFDSFDSDSESDNSFAKNDSGVDMGNTQLPDPPSNHQTYAFTRFAASAGKNVMKRLRRNWSMRKNDISKSLSRITKRKSRTDLDTIDNDQMTPPSIPDSLTATTDKHKSRGFLNKFKRSMSMTGDIGDNFADRPKSTFYLTEAIDVDDEPIPIVEDIDVKGKESPTLKNAQNNCNTMTNKTQKPNLVRPQMPPPPTPTTKSRSQSWYAECGVFKPDQQAPALPRRPNSFWYAEVGLYQSGSPPSTSSSSENSGNIILQQHDHHKEDSNSDDYYNKNYYNDSVKSFDSTDTKKDEAFNSLQGDIQLRLQDEPLYQFYDAAVLESVCQSSLSDFYDDYEEIEKGRRSSLGMNRPTAMEIVAPQRNNVSVARTLWCEIPEVVQSTVLSTLSMHQKKLQEAKFEMLTSEASYLNSLNVLTDHFVRKLKESDLLNEEDKLIMCGKIMPVKECSGKLLLDLEKCWQDNILLHGVCDIVKRHAEDNFAVYVSYCENQIVLDQTLKRLKEKPVFVEFLRQLEANSICQLLTLYSFLMLPMQRITRWPLLVDAILKRLSPQDDEYLSCQYALATLNKIVNQCNEGARNMERVTEMKKIAAHMEFAKGVPPIEVVNGHRWLVRSGTLTQMLNRGDDVKLTFGKRFTKLPVHLFLFNDIFMVAKHKGDGLYMVQHYCSRSYLELNSETLATLPTKDTQGRHLIFLTILENHDEKTVEMLLSCSSETDRERWLEALTPPKSENPDETLYECWDCPQVTAVHNYTANQPDELPLARGDVINVTRKMADGWYHGERIRDGETGWFPANYTMEVANPHVRARNLKQRYRLLAFSENYLKSK